ncbi:MAG: hypothetical protein KKE16_01110 [Firmicutes bacterium]|nr:hypothetical protein [Bacillota bacterium]
MKLNIKQKKQFYLFHPKLQININEKLYILKYGNTLSVDIDSGFTLITACTRIQKTVINCDLKHEETIFFGFERGRGKLKAFYEDGSEIPIESNITNKYFNIISGVFAAILCIVFFYLVFFG